jgi:hypothetical protein
MEITGLAKRTSNFGLQGTQASGAALAGLRP